MIRALIIDDEFENRDVITHLLEKHFDNIRVVGSADGVETGIDSIRKYSPDLVLLDIRMEDGLAFDLLSRLDHINFKIIFITAYEEYALKAIKFSALDYLLKPVSLDELKSAVKKAEQQILKDLHLQLAELNMNLQQINNKRVVLRTAEKLHIIPVRNIMRCEAERNYSKFYLVDNKSIIVSSPMKDFEDMLIEQGFFRTHKSHIVNLSFIESYAKSEGGNVILTDGSSIPVAERKKSSLMNIFSKL